MNDMSLVLENLRKTYGTVQALKGVNYEFKCGVYGILGANGAGKSTMINLITDNIDRDKKDMGGRVLYNGKDILKYGESFRELIGYMPQQQGFYEDFSAKSFLYYMAEIKGIKRKAAAAQIAELLKIVNLSDVADKKIGGFSGGMRQRLMLAQALLGNPRILIMDEPTAGLDPKERIAIRNYISELSSERIVLLATHIVSDIESIADCVLLMKKGEIIKSGTPEELVASVEDKVFEYECDKESVASIRKKYRVGNTRQHGDRCCLRLICDDAPDGAEHIRKEEVNLEDVYLYYVDEIEDK